MKWISVKEQLPKVANEEHYVRCFICCVLQGIEQVFEASFSVDSLDGEVSWYAANERISIYDNEDVTHWMYLPQPPKKNKANDK